MEFSFLTAMSGLLIWLAVLLLPWRPWSTRETLDSKQVNSKDLSEVTVLIPARNEAQTIAETLSALHQQGENLTVIVVDDQSTDNTAEIASSCNLSNLKMITSRPLVEGWSGKLWALEQGRQQVKTDYLLLLDADIVLKPQLIPSLLKFSNERDLKMLSLMARLRMVSRWEKLLMPAFIFFFKLLYPFQLSNHKGGHIAAAAGGCILLNTKTLAALGGFECIKDALIDDCSLAKQFKQADHKTWIGLSHSALSIRCYDNLNTIWQMVTRTAYTQLAYSPGLLLLCTLLMYVAFVLPLHAILTLEPLPFLMGILTWLLQVICYSPTLRYYSLPQTYALFLPVIGLLYLIMTWHSAFNYYFGQGSIWKGRHYG